MATYNALKYTQRLEDAGFTREQAQETVKTVIETVDDNFATKFDLKETEYALKGDIQAVRTELKQEMQVLRHDMKQIENRLTIKMGAMMMAGIAILQFLK